MNATERVPNRLINETSPYLLQHAYNPVDWWPWCDEAFAKAKAEDKPVFLSIGYSTCHWCHVMEEESFMDAEVAEYLNGNFIAVKVDKEERPDVDSVYMAVCQALTGSGGWPTTILMTPAQKPFFAGTYLPKHSRYGHFGLMELLATVKRKWDTEPDSLIESGNHITSALSRMEENADGITPPDKSAVEKAERPLARIFDEKWGGFGEPPKFPMPHQLMFLLRCHALGVSSGSLSMAKSTLQKMYQGGIFDHVGFGFSRYSTDRKWLAPHFEKMLYDNALLAAAYTECHQATGETFYREVAEMVFDYVERELTSPERGFYCAQDADSGGEEGAFYTFTRREILDILGEADGELFCRRYGVTDSGNFEGKSIPNLIREEEPSMPDDDMRGILLRLREYRAGRYDLHKDDKILASWNALMITAYAKASSAFGDVRYLERAVGAFEFIETRLTDADGGLLISYRDGKAKGRGLLDDYAFLAWACLELYEAAFDIAYLEKACGLMNAVLARFSDKSGGFFLSPDDGETFIIRSKERFDGAVPSGNSVAAHCLSKLAALTGAAWWREAADRQLASFSDMFAAQPTACTFALLPLMREVYPACELVCAAQSEDVAQAPMRELGRKFLPQMSVILKTPENAERLARIAPFTAAYPIPEKHKLAFYLCRGGSCSAPVYDLGKLMEMLQ